MNISDKRLPSTLTPELLGSNINQTTTRFHQKEKNNEGKILLLQAELRQVRLASINANRKGDFRKVAILTTRAADINKHILNYQIGIYDNFVC